MIEIDFKILVYFILSSDEEAKSLNKKNLKNFIKISNNISFLVIDNRKIKGKISLKKYDGLLIFNQETPKSLIENISTVINNYNYPFYLRLDPDDDYDPALVREISESIGLNNIVVANYLVQTKEKKFNLNHENGQFDYFEPLGAGILISRQIQELTLRTCKGLKGQDNFALWIHLLTRNLRIIHLKKNYIYNQFSHNQGMSRQKLRIVKERLEIINRIFIEQKNIYFLRILQENIKPFEFKIVANIIYLRIFSLGVIAPIVFLYKNLKFKKIKIMNFLEDQLIPCSSEEMAFCCLTNSSILIKCKFDRSFYNQRKISINLKKKNMDIKNVKILGL